MSVLEAPPTCLYRYAVMAMLTTLPGIENILKQKIVIERMKYICLREATDDLPLLERA